MHTALISRIYNGMQLSVIFRCEASLKQRAEAIAKERDETLSQVLRRALRAYVAEHARIELSKAPRGGKGARQA